MKKQTIKRETFDSYKGFPYQKKKTAHRALELYNTQNKFTVIPEYIDDIFVQVNDETEITQVKNSDTRAFTLNTKDVYKSIVIFLDTYFESKKDSNTSFCLYTNTSIGKESGSEFEEISEPILELIKEKKLDNKILTIISTKLTSRYKEIYDDNKNVDSGYYQEVQDMELKEWKTFLFRIDFSFGEKSDDELFESSINLIRESENFSRSHFGREEDILHELLNIVDNKMANKRLFERIINKDNLDLIFEKKKNQEAYKVSSKACLETTEWERIENEIKEKRNIEEKIRAVCTQIDPRLMDLYKLKASIAIADLDSLSQSEQISLKQRIYSYMLEFVVEHITETKTYSSNEIKNIIQSWQDFCVVKMNELKKDIQYTYSNDDFIKSLVLFMIDQCYYKFEVEEIA